MAVTNTATVAASEQARHIACTRLSVLASSELSDSSSAAPPSSAAVSRSSTFLAAAASGVDRDRCLRIPGDSTVFTRCGPRGWYIVRVTEDIKVGLARGPCAIYTQPAWRGHA